MSSRYPVHTKKYRSRNLELQALQCYGEFLDLIPEPQQEIVRRHSDEFNADTRVKIKERTQEKGK